MSDKTTQKVAGITGATGAIGYAIASQLATQNYRVILLTRDPIKSKAAVESIKSKTGNQSISFNIVDLSRRSSILKLASSWEGPLHVLVNNAAVTPQNRLETPEGIELQFATNVLGYFWMIEFFSEILSNSAPSRIVNVASYWAGGLDLDDLEYNRRPYHNHDAYRQSKQANRMLTPVFSTMLESKNVTVNSCHPGDVNSSLSKSLGFGGTQSPDDGAKTPVWLASSSDLNKITGKYIENCRESSCPFGAHQSRSHQLYVICQSYA